MKKPETITVKNKLYIVFFIVFISVPVFAKASSFSYGFTAAFENQHFLVNRDQHTSNDVYKAVLETQFIYDNQNNFKVDLHPWLRINLSEKKIEHYIPNEAYFLYYKSWLEMSGGLQVYTIGYSEFYNPTKVFIRSDLAESMYAPNDLGELMFQLKIIKPQWGLLTDLSLEMIVEPWFQETHLPENESRFALAGNFGAIPYEIDAVQDHPQTSFQSIGWGVVLKGLVATFEWEIIYYHGPERTPAYYLTTDSGGSLRLRPFYYTIDMVGANFSYPIGRLLLRTELAGKITVGNNAVTHDLPNQTDNLVPRSYFQFVPGVDYTIENIMGEHILRLTAEYYGENNRRRELAEYRPLKNDLFIGFDYDFNNCLMSHVRLGFLKDLSNTELAIIIETKTKLYRELTWEVKAVIVNRDSDPNAPLSYFDNNSYITSTLSYAFGHSE